jgi:hypothetical protein
MRPGGLACDRGEPDGISEVSEGLQHGAAGRAELSRLVARGSGVEARLAWDAYVVRHRPFPFVMDRA